MMKLSTEQTSNSDSLRTSASSDKDENDMTNQVRLYNESSAVDAHPPVPVNPPHSCGMPEGVHVFEEGDV